MLAILIFTVLAITIFLSAIAVFKDVAKHELANNDTLKDIFNNK